MLHFINTQNSSSYYTITSLLISLSFRCLYLKESTFVTFKDWLCFPHTHTHTHKLAPIEFNFANFLSCSFIYLVGKTIGNAFIWSTFTALCWIHSKTSSTKLNTQLLILNFLFFSFFSFFLFFNFFNFTEKTRLVQS